MAPAYVTEVSLGGYDTRGNVLTRTQAGATQGFSYDLADRVLTTTRNGVLQATHVYDGNGLRTRTSKPAPGAPQPDRDLRFQIYTPGGVFQWENDIECSRLRSRGVNYVRLAGSLLAKVVADSTLTQAECYPGTSSHGPQPQSLNPFRNPFAGATEVVAGNDGGREGEAPSAPTSTTTYSIVYVHTDALGSPVAETNINATVIPGSRTQYEPYGKPLTTPREGAPSYTGHQYDTSTGLIYAQQRYYDPTLGRFLSTDPMAVDMGAAGNWNRYAYAANSPYRVFDPDGRDAVAIGFPDYKIEFAGSKWSNLGHAGVLLINPANGLTRYYEFGRYNGTSGLVRNISVSDVVMENGAPTTASLAKVIGELSQKAGQGGPIEGAYFVKAEFKMMAAFAAGLTGKTSGNGGYGDWSPYHSCAAFTQDTLEKGGVDTPWMVDPRANSYVGELQGAKGAQGFRFQSGGFKGVFRVEGRIDSQRLDRELKKK